MTRLLCVALALLGILAWGVRDLRERRWRDRHRRSRAEEEAPRSLRWVFYAQRLYCEGDKDGDGAQAYAPSLKALIDTGSFGQEDLIDAALASGTKQGYVFAITSASAGGFTASADPAIPGTTGERYFGINQRGELFVSDTAPIRFDRDGSAPDRLVRVVR